MSKKEQSVADLFRDFARERALRHGYVLHSFSLDGQDRDVGADYVFTSDSQFALIEFKYEASDLISEAHKPRRLSLCKGLAMRPDMRGSHDVCHFIAWSNLPTSVVNVYRREICNRRVFGGESELAAATDQSANRTNAGAFVDSFLGGDKSLTLDEFNDYLEWVMETSGAGGGSVSLLARDPSADELIYVSLSSISAAHKFVQQHWPRPAPRQGPSFSP